MKKKSKSAAYPLLQVFIVIVIFLLIDFWSVGSFENYKKMSDFRSKILSDDIKLNKFPSDELFGIKLFDKIDNYLLEGTKISVENANNKKYLEISHSKSSNAKYKFKIEVSSLDEHIVVASEDRRIKMIIGADDDMLRLKGNNNFSNICTNSRNAFLKKHNLPKSSFIREFYHDSVKGAQPKEFYDDFFDFLSIDYAVNNKNVELSKSEKVRLSIACLYDIDQNQIEYGFALLLYAPDDAFRDLAKIDDHWIKINRPFNNWIRKYRNYFQTEKIKHQKKLMEK